jgi:hypothetical protein
MPCDRISQRFYTAAAAREPERRQGADIGKILVSLGPELHHGRNAAEELIAPIGVD